MSDDQYISPEEYKMSSKQAPPKKTVTFPARAIGLVAAAVILCGLSFAGGISYQKHHQPTAKTSTSGAMAGGFQGRGGFGQRGGGIGQVTAISPTSISVQDQRSGTSMTYSITSSTSITDNAQTVTTDDIKTGDTVIVMPTSSGGTTANRILVNPSFGGGAGGSTNPDQSSGSSTTQSE